MKAKIETAFGPCSDTREISIEYDGRSFRTIYGRHINGWFLCMPGRNISCELANPAEGSEWNLFHLTEAFEETGLDLEAAKEQAKAILSVIYDYENYYKNHAADTV